MPLNPTVVVFPVEELLVMTRDPVTGPGAPVEKLTFSTVDCPGSSVTGNVAPETEKPVPVTVVAVTVTGRLPLEVSVRGNDELLVSSTSPNDKSCALTVSVETAAVNCSAKLFDEPAKLAVNVTVCAVGTGE
jgi:hypothetical protein